MAYTYEVGDIVKLEKEASVWQFRVGDPACGRRFSSEMHRMRTSDYDTA